jgi:DNA-binding transcriptional ArsR family regulator
MREISSVDMRTSQVAGLTNRPTLLTLDSVTDPLQITTPEQMRALAHPTRYSLLRQMGADGATISQLANRLSTHKGNVAHHLGVLERAGLVRKGPTRTVRGGTEQYYVPVARRLLFDDGEGDATAAMLRSVGEEIVRAKQPLLTHRTLHLTRRQADALAKHLEQVVDGLEPADSREPTYGVLVSVYRRP